MTPSDPRINQEQEKSMSLQYIVKTSLVAAAAVVSLAQVAVAAPASPPGARMASAEQAGGIETHDPRKLVNTYVSVGNGGALGAGLFNTIESRTVNCANAAGCHIGQESMVQLAPGGGNWAICLAVNGVYTTCQFQGHLPDVGTFVTGNARGFSVAVPQGVHTVQTDVFVSLASTLAQWQTDHRVYKP
jgi:hypothetical protein